VVDVAQILARSVRPPVPSAAAGRAGAAGGDGPAAEPAGPDPAGGEPG
jgi:hypothetical protein